MDLWFAGGAILVLLMLSAFFSGSETALTAASRARLHALEQEGNARASVVNRLLAARERLIGALLLGNNLVNILASSVATGVLIALFGDAGVAYATLAMTLLVLVFAEVMPKTYALNHADRVALAIGPIIRMIVILFGPITAAITWIIVGLFNLLGIKTDPSNTVTSIEELRGQIELHRGGVEEAEEEPEETKAERAMLRSILELGNVDVSQIMTHRRNVVMVDASQPAEKIVADVLESPFTRIPVWVKEPDNIVGVIHAKALLRAVDGCHGDLSKLDVMTVAAKPWFIPDTTTLLDQLQTFRRRREHFALVVDEYGAIMGVVTLEDILEEIVGDIVDEHDRVVAGVRALPNHSFIIDGTVPIRDLNREFEWRLPDSDYATIAGLVLHESRRIPDVGQTFTFYDFRFEILRRQRNQITLLKVTPPEEVKSQHGTTTVAAAG